MRLQTYRREDAEWRGGSVAGALHRVFDPARVHPFHLKFACEHGEATDPLELWETMLGLTEQRYRYAPMHGDNVRIRGADASVIDLLSVSNSPLIADLAALETWLAFETPPEGVGDEGVWRKAIDELYEPSSFDELPRPASDDHALAWMWGCVRQIRMMGLPTQICRTEYQTAVAVFLLRRSMWKGDSLEDTRRRSCAFLAAVRLVKDLIRRNTA